MISGISNILYNSRQAVFYGFNHCRYDELPQFFITNKIIDRAFKWFTFGMGFNSDKTLEGRTIGVITSKDLRLSCKSLITLVIIENYKRKKEGLDLIPIIFVVDIDNNPYPMTVESVTTKEAYLNQKFTHCELRRCYRMIYDLPPDLKEISTIAQASIKFVKVGNMIYDKTKPISLIDVSLSEVQPIWNNPNWKKAWDERKAQSVQTRFKYIDWRDEIRKSINDYDNLKRT